MTVDLADIDLIRKSFESALAEGSDDVVALLRELGWAELHEAEPKVAIAELFEAQGRLGRTTSAVDVVVAYVLGRPLPAGTAVVHPAICDGDGPPGRSGANGAVGFVGLVLSGTERAERLLIPFRDRDGGLSADTAELAGSTVRLIGGFDPSLRLVAVSGRLDHTSGSVDVADTGWGAVALAARRALAHELCAHAQAMLDQAAAYVGQRHQFGRPIAAFQTVRHRLTEVLVAILAARSALDAGWVTGDPLLADAAKTLAGRAALLAARHCLQVTGAIGFTEEYDLAARIRRVHMLDALYGSADQLQARIGSRLFAERAVPRFHPLS